MEYYFAGREEWRRWLEENYGTSNELWMIIYKKHTGKEGIKYFEAVEEALCFGWIDGKIKRINDEYYIQRYTPRKPGSRWSKYNIERVEKLIKNKRMKPAGVNAYNKIFKNPGLVYGNRSSGEVVIPEDLFEALVKSRTALENFGKFSSSAKRIFIDWLNSAKRTETREGRIQKIFKASEKNEHPGML